MARRGAGKTTLVGATEGEGRGHASAAAERNDCGPVTHAPRAACRDSETLSPAASAVGAAAVADPAHLEPSASWEQGGAEAAAVHEAAAAVPEAPSPAQARAHAAVARAACVEGCSD